MSHVQHLFWLKLSLGLTLGLGLSACGGEQAIAPSNTAASAAAPVASSPNTASEAANSAPVAASAPTAATAECSTDLSANDAMQYSSKEIAIPASCQQFTVHFKHAGSMPKAAMGHNVVVAKTSDLNGVIKDGMKAGPAADYVKAGDERVLAKTKLLGGGESDSLTLDVAAIKAAPYSFVCTFPGHTGSMRGTIVVK